MFGLGGFFDLHEMLLIGDGAAGLVPFVQAALHELVVGQAFAVGAGFGREFMAKTVDYEDGIGMDHGGDFGFDGFAVAVLGDFQGVAVADAQFFCGCGVDPENVFGHLLCEHGVIDSVALGVGGAAAEGQAELAFGRGFRRLVRFQ